MPEEEIGKVLKYFTHVGAAVVEITKGKLEKGDTVAIRGHTTNLEQDVESMQIEHNSVDTAEKGDQVGIKVTDRVRPNDIVYKVVGEEE